MLRFAKILLAFLLVFALQAAAVPVLAESGGGGTTGGTQGGGGTTGGVQGGGGTTGGLQGGGGTTAGPGAGNGLQNPLKNVDSLPQLLDLILDVVVELGLIVLTLMLVYTGFKFVIAQGNAEELKSARSMLIWTVIGGLVLLGAKAISAVIQATASTL